MVVAIVIATITLLYVIRLSVERCHGKHEQYLRTTVQNPFSLVDETDGMQDNMTNESATKATKIITTMTTITTIMTTMMMVLTSLAGDAIVVENQLKVQVFVTVLRFPISLTIAAVSECVRECSSQCVFHLFLAVNSTPAHSLLSPSSLLTDLVLPQHLTSSFWSSFSSIPVILAILYLFSSRDYQHWKTS